MASFARGAASLIRIGLSTSKTPASLIRIGLSTSKTPLQLIHRRGLAGDNLDDASMHQRFEQWMKEYGKVYKDSAEMQKRFLIFRDNVERIASLNDAGKGFCTFGINGFADLTDDEVCGCAGFRKGLK